MKAKNLIIGQMIFVITFLSFSFKLRSQDFITQWTFGKTTNQVHFNAETTDTVTYTWTALPSGNTGSGIFIQTTADTVTLRNLDVLKGDTLKLSMNPSKLRRFYIDNGPDKTNLINVIQWGSVPWTSMNSAFKGCANLKIDAKDNPDLSNVVDMSFMFAGAFSFNQNIGNWNTSNVTNMSNMFERAWTFNQDIGNWNTSNVINMSYMFSWDTSFNQDIGNWNTENVQLMSNMFDDAWAFNQDIGNWNTSRVVKMSGMFLNATSFNQFIGKWNTSIVTNMIGMFDNARSFNQNIGTWNVENVQYMDFMFRNASVFNQDIGRWNVSKVGSMAFAFYNATSFNQDIGNWNTSSVKSMWNMFFGAKLFNKYIGGWNTSNVTSMYGMFSGASSFNQDIGNWNTSNVKNMGIMFDHASSFNQNLGKWNLMENVGLANMLDYSGLDCYNYSNTLIGWLSNNPTIKYIKLGSYGLKYGTNAEPARNTLINSQGWTINGDSPSGKDCATVGIHNEESITDLILYPNPTSGILNIEDNNGYFYSISDLTGKVVINGIINLNSVSLESLPCGIYYLTVINSDSPQTIKVFKF